jgi:hypothetical protein
MPTLRTDTADDDEVPTTVPAIVTLPVEAGAGRRGCGRRRRSRRGCLLARTRLQGEEGNEGDECGD